MIKILFLCTGNSCRSQMAEGIINHHFRGKAEAKSAGIEPTAINPFPIEVMKEIGIDISDHRVNHPEDFQEIEFDYVITLCDHARESCPAFLAQKTIKRIHMGFPDPALFKGTQQFIIRGFREVRDSIRKKLIDFVEKLED